MKYFFHPEAEKEFNQAIDYYNTLQHGLGIDFAKEVSSAIQDILLFPKAWSHISKNTQRRLINRFPYGIIFQEYKNKILIIAIMQLNRKPGYWTKR